MTRPPGQTCVVTGATSGIGRGSGRRARRERRAPSGRSVGRANGSTPLATEARESAGRRRARRRRSRARRRRARGEPPASSREANGSTSSSIRPERSCSAPSSRLPAEDFDRLYRVNLRAPFVLTQDLLPALRRARGQVVFVNSSAGLRASALNVLYAATKHGLKAIADGLRDEVNADGIRVDQRLPGRTATAMQQFVHEHEGGTTGPSSCCEPKTSSTSWTRSRLGRTDEASASLDGG